MAIEYDDDDDCEHEHESCVAEAGSLRSEPFHFLSGSALEA
jgi:hypothetical protein